MSVETPVELVRDEKGTSSAPQATAVPEPPLTSSTPAVGEPPGDGAPDLSRRRLGERLRRIAPFFAGSRRGFVLAVVGALVAAATEPAIPALL